MSDRPSRTWLMFRMFGTIFVIVFLISLFWNTLSGRDMFPIAVAFWVSVVLTVWFTLAGWVGVTAGSQVLLRNDAEFQKWKQRGGRPFWDGALGWPINTATDIERETGIAEPQYPPGMTPPDHHRFQCPVCGCRVEKQIDVCPLLTTVPMATALPTASVFQMDNASEHPLVRLHRHYGTQIDHDP